MRTSLPWRHRSTALVAALALSASAIAGCDALDIDLSSATGSSTQSESVPSQRKTVNVTVDSSAVESVEDPAPAAPDVQQALEMLAELAVKGRAPKTGYKRALFGQAWTDDADVEGSGNGCDTRNDLIKRDLTDLTIKRGTHGCVVLSGTLEDEYTGKTINFVRGKGTSSKIQVDHVVALGDSWQKGAQQLTARERVNLANDPRNLQLVDGPTNSAKGAGDAATWLPPRKAYRCTYIQRQILVKSEYKLWVTKAEKAAMTRILNRC